MINLSASLSKLTKLCLELWFCKRANTSKPTQTHTCWWQWLDAIIVSFNYNFSCNSLWNNSQDNQNLVGNVMLFKGRSSKPTASLWPLTNDNRNHDHNDHHDLDERFSLVECCCRWQHSITSNCLILRKQLETWPTFVLLSVCCLLLWNVNDHWNLQSQVELWKPTFEEIHFQTHIICLSRLSQSHLLCVVLLAILHSWFLPKTRLILKS